MTCIDPHVVLRAVHPLLEPGAGQVQTVGYSGATGRTERVDLVIPAGGRSHDDASFPSGSCHISDLIDPQSCRLHSSDL